MSISETSELTFETVYSDLLKNSLNHKYDKRSFAEKQAGAATLALSIIGQKQLIVPPSDTKGGGPTGQYLFRHVDEQKETAEWHKFSKSLAIEMNPKRPDIAGALILYGLSLWMKLAQKTPQKLKFCYRSLSELHQDHPYLTESGIEHALKRLGKALKGSFQILHDGPTLRFRVSEKLIKRMDTDEKMMFRIEHAKAYSIPAALLLSNLAWQLAPTKKEAACHRPPTAIKDQDGMCYFPLSPTTLTQVDPVSGEAPILPMSRWTVTRALNDLVEGGVITEHPSSKCYYTLASLLGAKNPSQLSAGTKNDGAKRDTCGARRDSRGAKRDDYLCIDSNKIVNADSKVTSLPTVPAAPSLCGASASPGLKYLQESWNKRIQQLKAEPLLPTKLTTVSASRLPYDSIRSPHLDLPYDVFLIHPFTGKVFTHHDQVDEYMEEIVTGWKEANFPYTRADLTALRNIFLALPDFDLDRFQDIQQHLIQNRITLCGAPDFKRAKMGKWDSLYFAKRIKSARALVLYLPELIEEMHMEVFRHDGELVKNICMDETHQEVVDYLRTPAIGNEPAQHESNPMLEAA